MTENRIPIAFFATPSGTEPVRDWLKGLDKPDRVRIGEDLNELEFGWPVGMPLCRPMGQGLYELRSSLKDRIARLLFGFVEDRLVIVHGFIKKSRATPKSDLELARSRLKSVKEWR
jgi:phage-related protein